MSGTASTRRCCACERRKQRNLVDIGTGLCRLLVVVVDSEIEVDRPKIEVSKTHPRPTPNLFEGEGR